jgi:hypothetical protein
MPAEYKVPIALVSWLSGVIGFSIKEALGSKPAAENLKKSP